MSGDGFSWEKDIYAQGQHLNRYPFDCVVQFVFRHAPRNVPRSEVRLLEVGCGAGNNLWFAAREGFSVAGVDISETALGYARERFRAEGLEGDFRVGEFSPLPWEGSSFHLVLDRGALTCVDSAAIERAVAEIRRVLVPGGKFFFNIYSDQHSSCLSGNRGDDGLVRDMNAGTMQLGEGSSLNFFSRSEIVKLFRRGWKMDVMELMDIVDMTTPEKYSHSEWRVVVSKQD